MTSSEDNLESRQKPLQLVGLALDCKGRNRKLTTGFPYIVRLWFLKPVFLAYQQLVLLYSTGSISERSH